MRILPYIAAVLLVLGGLYGAYHHGVSTTNATWQAQWNARDTRDAQAKESNEDAERTKEQAWQLKLNKVTEDGQKIIDTAVADATAPRADLGLRDAADETARRIAARQASGHSCTTAASAAATRAVMVLADVLKRSDERSGDLAGYADQSHGRGVTCEQAYDGLSK